MAIESEKPEINYIRYLKNNLLDSYKYGDGFTVFKELIQNASDAEADILKVYVIDEFYISFSLKMSFKVFNI